MAWVAKELREGFEGYADSQDRAGYLDCCATNPSHLRVSLDHLYAGASRCRRPDMVRGDRMRSILGAAGRVSLSVLLALALCPTFSLEAFADGGLPSDSSGAVDAAGGDGLSQAESPNPAVSEDEAGGASAYDPADEGSDGGGSASVDADHPDALDGSGSPNISDSANPGTADNGAPLAAGSTAAAASSSGNASISAVPAAEEDLDWQPCGTCEWAIDGTNTLIVRPANGAEVGELPSWAYSPWSWSMADIVSARFLGTVVASTCGGMFARCSSLAKVDFTGLVTSNVTKMDQMFYNCPSLETVDLSNLDMTRVESMSGMFYGCTSLSSIDLSKYKLPSVRDIVVMFGECANLQVADLSGVGSGALDNLSGLFINCSSLKSVDLTGLYTFDAQEVSGVFNGCNSLASVTVSDGFNFEGTYGLPAGSNSYWLSSSDQVAYEGGNMPSGINAEYARITAGLHDQIYRCGGCEWVIDHNGLLTIRPANGVYGELRDWGINPPPWSGFRMIFAVIENGVKAACAHDFFFGCSYLESIDLSGLDASDITDFSDMFAQCGSLTDVNLADLGKLSPENVSGMFSGCDSLKTIDLSNLNTENTTDFSRMFNNCRSFLTLDLSALKTGKAENMSGMFAYCTSLEQLDLSNFDTSNVTNFSEMFYCSSSLRDINVSSFDTANATDMSSMFGKCEMLETLQLATFDTSNVKNFSHMFASCSNLQLLDITSFDTSKATSMEEMFYFVNNENVEISLGEGFTFNGYGWNRLCDFPTIPVRDYSNRNITGKWVNTDTGEVYSKSEIPSNIKATYSPQVVTKTEPIVLSGRVYVVGDPCTGISLRANAALDDACLVYYPNLLYQWFDEGTDEPVSGVTDSPIFVIPENGMGKSYYCVVSTDEENFIGSIMSYGIYADHSSDGLWHSDKSSHWHSCSYCGSSMDFAAHTFGDWGVTKEATCTAFGERTRRCSLCGYVDIASIPASGHSYGDEWFSDSEVHWKVCSVCEAKGDEAAHEFGSWTVTAPATCTEIGSESRVCSVCGYEETRSIPVTGHSASQKWSSDASKHWHACLECGAALDEAAHSFGAWSVTEPATCTEDGSESRSCSVCGCGESRVVPATGHSFGGEWIAGTAGHWRVCSACGIEGEVYPHEFTEWAVTEQATCTAAGEESRSCTACGYVETRSVPALGHTPAQGWLSDASGHWQVCSTCGSKGQVSAHSFGAWATVQQPTVDVPGVEERACSVCGYAEQREMPVVVPSNPFIDVHEGSTPHYDHILWLAYTGVSTGWDVEGGGKEFRPWDNVARCDMAAFLYRLAGEPAFEPSAADLAAFVDVDESTPHYEAVLWLASTGISEGWDLGGGKREFRPYDDIARIDMAAFLHRLANWMGAPEATGVSMSFPDVSEGMPHAEDVRWLSAAGITTGFQNGTYRPYSSIVRCDMAAMLHRLDGFVNGYEVE